MQVETTRFGVLDVGEETLVFFPEGLLGFGAYREYVLVPAGPSGGPLVWLQSCQQPELAFALCRAESLVRDYRVEVRAEEMAATEMDRVEDAAVYLIIHRDGGDLVANLRGPLVVNEARRLGKQVVINDKRTPLRHRIRKPRPAPEAEPVHATRRAV